MCSSSMLSSWTRPRRKVETLLVLLLGLPTLLVNACLSPADADYRCEVNDEGSMTLEGCGITDEDIDDLAACLDAAGRENIVTLFLGSNSFTTLPEGIFGGLTALVSLFLGSNGLTTLPEGVFDGLTNLHTLRLEGNVLTTLPEGALGGLTALNGLDMSNNVFTTLPEGLFVDLTALDWLRLDDNAVTALPKGIFASLTGLAFLSLEGNALECLPVTPSRLEKLDGHGAWNADGVLRVGAYGDECGCSVLGVTDNLCGRETCTPGPVGYTCGGSIQGSESSNTGGGDRSVLVAESFVGVAAGVGSGMILFGLKKLFLRQARRDGVITAY